MRGSVEDLGQVASRLLLDENGGDEEMQIFRWNARAHLQQCLAKGQTQPLLLEDLQELGGERLGRLLRNHLDGRVHRVAGAQRARHQIDGVGQSGVERLETPVAFAPQQGVRDDGSEDGCNSGNHKHVRNEEAEQSAAQRGTRAGQNDTAQTHAAVGVNKQHLELLPESVALQENSKADSVIPFLVYPNIYPIRAGLLGLDGTLDDRQAHLDGFARCRCARAQHEDAVAEHQRKQKRDCQQAHRALPRRICSTLRSNGRAG